MQVSLRPVELRAKTAKIEIQSSLFLIFGTKNSLIRTNMGKKNV